MNLRSYTVKEARELKRKRNRKLMHKMGGMNSTAWRVRKFKIKIKVLKTIKIQQALKVEKKRKEANK